MGSQRLCLLITEQFEPTADWLIEEMRRRGAPCVRWNLDRFPIGSSVSFRVSSDGFDGEIRTDGRTIDLAGVGSVWCRGFRPSGFPDNLAEVDRPFALSESQRVLDALLTVTDPIWVNHPQRHARANSKPAQLFVASRLGFEIPRTVVTNDPSQARALIGTTDAAVYKAMSQNLSLDDGQALFTGIVTDEELASLDLIQVSPGVFQELVPKAYEVRATVVGTRIFAGKINSQARAETLIDWRRRPFDIENEPIELPLDLQTRIHAFMDHFGLLYGAFDFIVTPDGRYVFLEINPAGQYMWVETATRLPITSALVDVLSTSPPARPAQPPASSPPLAPSA